MRADLHTHTSASDGTLSPAEVMREAQAAGVELLAITDHDTLDGVLAVNGSVPEGLRLVTGIELSANWGKIGVHVVGLNVDVHNPTLLDGIEYQTRVRKERAEIIAERLEKAGFSKVLAGAQQVAAGRQIGRPHFARYLVDSGQIKDISTAFKRHLGRGTRGDVRQGWPELETVIEWIHAAKGVAVLAHPAKYKLTNLRLEELSREFKAAGGDAIEVVSGFQNSQLTEKLGRLANRHGLRASVGSDFHQPGQHWAGLGAAPALPSNCRPVWEGW